MTKKTSRVDLPVPPPHLQSPDDGDFLEVGARFREYFIRPGGMKPTDRVLEVGCGNGRMAVGLIEYLEGTGSYDGFDIIPERIEWCHHIVSSRFPSFRFLHSDIHNKMYNPGGRLAAVEYRFPYEDDSFDYVLLTSVFTHLLRPDMEHYLSEIRRVMRPGARCFITYFLLNEESRSLKEIELHPLDGDVSSPMRVADLSSPELAVAFDEGYIRELYRERGLSIEEPIRYGRWCGRAEALDYQDIVLAVKQRN